MFKTTILLTINQQQKLKQQLLSFARQFEYFMLLDSNLDLTDSYSEYQWIFACGAHRFIQASEEKNNFELLDKFYNEHKTDLFGFLGYELKNEIENLNSNNPDNIEFPDMFFFEPEISIWASTSSVEVKSHYPFNIEILPEPAPEKHETITGQAQHRINHETYTEKVGKLLKNIQLGNIYEANFCMEFYAEKINVNPYEIYAKLSTQSNAPFGVFFKLKDKFLLSASPERYLKKNGAKLIAQPMKGTARRSQWALEDMQLKLDLENNLKERSENIMICDLVRNDLSKIAASGSVTVEELCKVYTYPMVHQMISTITCQVAPEITVAELLKSCFPPGSMTGAPKVRAMQLIEEHETTKRGLYSGCVGYITEIGNFDFNVVIRSLQYNQTNQYLSYMTGSAITSLSAINDEYNECLLKSQAFFNLLNPQQ